MVPKCTVRYVRTCNVHSTKNSLIYYGSLFFFFARGMYSFYRTTDSTYSLAFLFSRSLSRHRFFLKTGLSSLFHMILIFLSHDLLLQDIYIPKIIINQDGRSFFATSAVLALTVLGSISGRKYLHKRLSLHFSKRRPMSTSCDLDMSKKHFKACKIHTFA